MRDLETLAPLVDLLRSEDDIHVLRKLVLALSAVLKNQPDTITAFARADGLQLLHPLLQCTDANVVQRVVFLLTQLMHQDAAVKAAVVEGPVLPSLVSFAASTQPHLQEKVLAALLPVL